jgi:ATP-dependent helicase/nuclease subunit B
MRRFMPSPSIYAIAFDQPFLDTLVAGLMQRAGKDPLVLARMTVLLPTRRAARSLREAFLRAGNGKALLLPRMIPVGDLDPEELALLTDEGEAGGAGFDLPPAISELRRRLMLTQLVQAFERAQGNPIAPGQAAALAADLARFLDEVQAEGRDFSKLCDLAPEKYAEHWQKILRFLAIVTDHWPAMLAEIGCLDPAERRNQLLAAQASAWREDPPPGPVIAAGIAGGLPAVADLMAVVATLPQGAVVLPGLDTEADGASWEEILLDATHPRHLAARFLARLEVDPKTVPPWTERAAASLRARLVREVLAPASLSHRWRFVSGLDPKALHGLRRIDCPGPQEEGLTIALLLRERLERAGETAALITPDRALGRRVAAELQRWDIDIDDSAGVPLNKTPPGVFLRLVLDLVAQELAPLPLLAALKHPLAALGRAPGAFREQVRALEIAALRGPRPEPGIAGLHAVLGAETGRLRALVDDLETALAPLLQALASREIRLDALVAAHLATCEALATRDDGPGAAFLWREAAGEAAALFLNELLQDAAVFPPLAGADYPALFEALLAGPVVRPPYGRHPRLFIWGLLEARLQHADLVVLGGLNEGVWPAAADSDPWLSRPMRRDFGLPPPERRIGMAALDFALGLGARDVVMTRATRVDGTPTVPSRWLLRLDTVLSAVGLEGKLGADTEALDWQRLIDEPTATIPVTPPEPRPPVKARPRKLSVTEIETWRRDPYAIYAKHVLRLRALDPIDADPSAADRGLIIHAALAKFLQAYPKRLPADAAMRLTAIGKECFGEALARPGIWAFWWPRFCRIADWVIAEETRRRPLLDEIFAEIPGKLSLTGPAGAFVLTARADRLERRRDGTIALIDYKTGTPPTGVEVAQGYAPQLPLEAAMIERGGFGAIAAASIGELAFWRLTGGNPAGEVKLPEDDPAELRDLIASAFAGVQDLVAAFDKLATPYRAVPVPTKAPRYSDYVHLARVKEWLAGNEAEE